MAPIEATAELKFVFQKNSVDEEIVKLLVDNGVTTTKQFGFWHRGRKKCAS